MAQVTVRADHRVFEKTNDAGKKLVTQEAQLRLGRDETKLIRVWPSDGKAYAPGDYDLDPQALRMVKGERGYDSPGYPFPSLVPSK